MSKIAVANIIFLIFLFSLACGTRMPASSLPTAQAKSVNYPDNRTVQLRDYQRLTEKVGDRCYPGNQFPTEIAQYFETPAPKSRSFLPRSFPNLFTSLPGAAFLSENHVASSFLQTASQVRKRAVSSVDDLSLLLDIEAAKFKNDELILIGPPAKEGEGFRPDDWYVVFRAIAGTEAPGVTIDPGPDPKLMQVRYFGNIQQTALGNTFFEADRTLKLFSTGFDNHTCAPWPDRPRDIPTELDLIGDEIGDGSRSDDRNGGWHRFWFEPSEESVETEGMTVRIPKNRLIVKDESIPPGQPSRKSAREFATALSTNFLNLTKSIRFFSDLQKDAALVILAKWIRDKQIPVDEDWVKGTPAEETTTTTTPSITVLRAKMLDQAYLRYGIHGGVDFQKDNKYGVATPHLGRLTSLAEQSAPRGSNSWRFNFDGQPYQAVRFKIRNPIQIHPHWIIWKRTVTRVLVQPRTSRATLPYSDLVVTNDSSEPLTIQTIGPSNKTERISAGATAVIRVIPGSYQIKYATNKCGLSSKAIVVAESERHQLRYTCQSVSTPIAPPPVTPQPTGVGYFEVNNNTGASLTVEVGGQVYTVAPGSSTIRLSPGFYTATIKARCGVTTESLNVTNGARFTGQYSCGIR